MIGEERDVGALVFTIINQKSAIRNAQGPSVTSAYFRQTTQIPHIPFDGFSPQVYQPLRRTHLAAPPEDFCTMLGLLMLTAMSTGADPAPAPVPAIVTLGTGCFGSCHGCVGSCFGSCYGSCHGCFGSSCHGCRGGGLFGHHRNS